MPRAGRISLVDGPGVAYMVDSLKENSDNAGSCIPPGIARRPRHRLDVLGIASMSSAKLAARTASRASFMVNEDASAMLSNRLAAES